jgi:DNA-directed RNA polymerase subunit H (RpoH/RPB5)
MSSKQKAEQTCLEMITQRGYVIIDYENITAVKPDGTKMIVFFNESPNFDTKSMKEIFSVMTESGVTHSIVVYKDKVTPATKNTLEQSEDIVIELFCEDDLQFNITKHRLQPTFEKLPDDEAVLFKKMYGTKFGILRVDRPISRFYNYQRGDVIRVKRSDGYINYRIVR